MTTFGPDRSILNQKTIQEIETIFDKLSEELTQSQYEFEDQLDLACESLPAWLNLYPKDIKDLFIFDIEFLELSVTTLQGPRTVAFAAGEVQAIIYDWIEAQKEGLTKKECDQGIREVRWAEGALKKLLDQSDETGTYIKLTLGTWQEEILEELQRERAEEQKITESEIVDASEERAKILRKKNDEAWQELKLKSEEISEVWERLFQLEAEGFDLFVKYSQNLHEALTLLAELLESTGVAAVTAAIRAASEAESRVQNQQNRGGLVFLEDEEEVDGGVEPTSSYPIPTEPLLDDPQPEDDSKVTTDALKTPANQLPKETKEHLEGPEEPKTKIIHQDKVKEDEEDHVDPAVSETSPIKLATQTTFEFSTDYDVNDIEVLKRGEEEVSAKNGVAQQAKNETNIQHLQTLVDQPIHKTNQLRLDDPCIKVIEFDDETGSEHLGLAEVGDALATDVVDRKSVSYSLLLEDGAELAKRDESKEENVGKKGEKEADVTQLKEDSKGEEISELEVSFKEELSEAQEDGDESEEEERAEPQSQGEEEDFEEEDEEGDVEKGEEIEEEDVADDVEESDEDPPSPTPLETRGEARRFLECWGEISALERFCVITPFLLSLIFVVGTIGAQQIEEIDVQLYKPYLLPVLIGATLWGIFVPLVFEWNYRWNGLFPMIVRKKIVEEELQCEIDTHTIKINEAVAWAKPVSKPIRFWKWEEGDAFGYGIDIPTLTCPITFIVVIFDEVEWSESPYETKNHLHNAVWEIPRPLYQAVVDLSD